MLRHATLLSLLVKLAAVFFLASDSHSFVLMPGVGRCMSTTATSIALDSTTPPASIDSSSSGTTKGTDTPGTSQLSIRNEEEGYDLNGILTVKRQESKVVWVLCHGLCSSCEGTVPRFVSEKLEANTFRSGKASFQRVALSQQ